MSGVRADAAAATFILAGKTADDIVYSNCGSKVKVLQSSFIHFHQTVALQATLFVIARAAQSSRAVA